MTSKLLAPSPGRVGWSTRFCTLVMQFKKKFMENGNPSPLTPVMYFLGVVPEGRRAQTWRLKFLGLFWIAKSTVLSSALGGWFLSMKTKIFLAVEFSGAFWMQSWSVVKNYFPAVFWVYSKTYFSLRWGLDFLREFIKFLRILSEETVNKSPPFSLTIFSNYCTKVLFPIPGTLTGIIT